MESTTTTTNNSSRGAAVGALAIVGFIALILIGIGLAIYTARYLPQLSSKVGGGAVSLSSIFHRDDNDSNLEVVTSTSTLPFADQTSTTTLSEPLTSTSTGSQTASTGTKSVSTAPPVTKYVTVTTTQTVQPYGDPDLTVDITDVGYLRSDGDTSTFVADRSIDKDNDGAVKFTVKNIGTNVTGTWQFKITVPSDPSKTYTSPTQRSLNPGDSMEFVLGFQNPREGDDRDITVTVDSGKDVHESNENNNEDSAEININN